MRRRRREKSNNSPPFCFFRRFVLHIEWVMRHFPFQNRTNRDANEARPMWVHTELFALPGELAFPRAIRDKEIQLNWLLLRLLSMQLFKVFNIAASFA